VCQRTKNHLIHGAAFAQGFRSYTNAKGLTPLGRGHYGQYAAAQLKTNSHGQFLADRLHTACDQMEIAALASNSGSDVSLFDNSFMLDAAQLSFRRMTGSAQLNIASASRFLSALPSNSDACQASDREAGANSTVSQTHLA
jgi:hypothetical protein